VRTGRAATAARQARGVTLVEVLLVLVVLGVLLGMAWPRFGRAGEQARVDEAASRLRSLWLAQRMHHLETGAFAGDLAGLEALRLIDRAPGDETEPFGVTLTSAGPDDFDAQAQRAGSVEWSGALLLDESGVIGGSSFNLEGLHVHPSGG